MSAVLGARSRFGHCAFGAGTAIAKTECELAAFAALARSKAPSRWTSLQASCFYLPPGCRSHGARFGRQEKLDPDNNHGVR